MKMDLGNKITSEFRAGFDSPLDVPNPQVPLHIYKPAKLTEYEAYILPDLTELFLGQRNEVLDKRCLGRVFIP